MKYFHQEHWEKSGIYQIINTFTGCFYLGQAKNFMKRWKVHTRKLHGKGKSNPHMKNSFHKHLALHGNDSFMEFHVVEVCAPEELNARENHYLALYHDGQKKCYNIQKTAECNEHVFSHTPEESRAKKSTAGMNNKNAQGNLGYIHTEEAKKLMSATHIGNKYNLGRKQSPEHIAKVSASLIGNKRSLGFKHTDETKKLMSAASIGRTHSPETKAKRVATQKRNKELKTT